eukprot:1158752-Pelagomonas_calceolata.AAC.2
MAQRGSNTKRKDAEQTSTCGRTRTHARAHRCMHARTHARTHTHTPEELQLAVEAFEACQHDVLALRGPVHLVAGLVGDGACIHEGHPAEHAGFVGVGTCVCVSGRGILLCAQEKGTAQVQALMVMVSAFSRVPGADSCDCKACYQEQQKGSAGKTGPVGDGACGHESGRGMYSCATVKLHATGGAPGGCTKSGCCA